MRLSSRPSRGGTREKHSLLFPLCASSNRAAGGLALAALRRRPVAPATSRETAGVGAALPGRVAAGWAGLGWDMLQLGPGQPSKIPGRRET